MRRRGASACALLIATLVTGCTVQPLDPDIVALIPPQTAGMDALLEGRLVIDDDCVYVDASITGPDYDRILPIFPSNVVRWDGDALMIVDAPHRDGDPVSLGGGFVAEPTSAARLPTDAHIPDGCSTEYAFLVAPF